MMDAEALMQNSKIACFPILLPMQNTEDGLCTVASKNFRFFRSFVEAIAQFCYAAFADIPKQDPVILP